MGRPFPVSASSSIELAVVGPHRPALVVAATAQAAYLAIGEESPTIICLAVADAVRVPCALIVESKSLPPLPEAGTIGVVGGGTLSIGASAYRVARWWRPPHPRGLGKVAPARLAGAVRWLNGRVADPLDSPGRAAVAELVHALSAGAQPDDAVARLLGRGPGLTPTGHDVLAGTLVTLKALGSRAATPLAEAVAAAAPRQTTAVSAALLAHAARGECIPQLADLLDAFTDTAVALPRAAGALLAVGHCSGAGLLHGVLVGVAIAHTPLSFGVLPHDPAVLPASMTLPHVAAVAAA